MPVDLKGIVLGAIIKKDMIVVDKGHLPAHISPNNVSAGVSHLSLAPDREHQKSNVPHRSHSRIAGTREGRGATVGRPSRTPAPSRVMVVVTRFLRSTARVVAVGEAIAPLPRGFRRGAEGEEEKRECGG